MQKIYKTLFFSIIISTLIAITFITTAAEDEPSVRIGVVPSEESITIGSESDFHVIEKESGEVLFSGENGEITVLLESSGGVKTNYRLQVTWTSSRENAEAIVAQAESYGVPTLIEEYNSGWRVYLGEFAPDAPWGERNEFRNEMIDLGLAGTDSFWAIVTVSEGTSMMNLSYNDEEQSVSQAIQLQPADGIVTINGSKYRGVAEVGFNSSGTLAGINELPVEDYLKGVVPRELPPVPYNELEAQKSQAVAARTYTLANLGKRRADGYDLLPTTSDQVYGGYSAEHPISSQAVLETRGVVARYDGNLINAVYHSTSGGFTANNEDVWNADPVPYLRGVPDSQRGKAFENIPSLNVFKNSSHARSLRNSKNGDFESDWSRYHRWTFEWTPEEITQVLSGYFGNYVGEVYDINVLDRADSGRVLEIEYVTENGHFYEYKDRIRWSLPYINDQGEEAVLLSTLFYIEPTKKNKNSSEPTGFVVYGGDWGHGVGLAQTGAVGMANKGATYEEILKHYYHGIELETRY